jgi:site-specific DNA-methyltransferase (adenine-specific)
MKQNRITKIEDLTSSPTCGKPLVMGSTVFNEDCMTVMARYPDKYFDLAVVDPPYGLGDRLVKGGAKGGMGSLRKLADNKVENWDVIPDEHYFNELFRVSKKQIIWGGNYFLKYLGATDGFLVWDKMNGTNPMADAELAWKSFEGTTRMFRMHHFSNGYDDKIHPTQKPTKLYDWIFKNYTKEGNLILDTHLGSGSSRIAAHKHNLEFVGCEIDAEYFASQEARFKEFTSQLRLFG